MEPIPLAVPSTNWPVAETGNGVKVSICPVKNYFRKTGAPTDQGRFGRSWMQWPLSASAADPC
jgi:hypothetical protein